MFVFICLVWFLSGVFVCLGFFKVVKSPPFYTITYVRFTVLESALLHITTCTGFGYEYLLHSNSTWSITHKLQMKKNQDDRTQINDNRFELLLAVVSFHINTIPTSVMLSILKSYFNCLSLITSPVIIYSRICEKSLTFPPSQSSSSSA